MTIARNLIARGYFPKELPPRFFTDQFAAYATSRPGKLLIRSYRPRDRKTGYGRYNLALPGLNQREIAILHPFGFAELAQLTARSMSRLLKKVGVSKFSKSRPVYQTGGQRALHPSVKPYNLARERANARAAGSYLLKADVSHFYPALYTHAVGWAVDPRLRQRANWRNSRLLGKKLDQALMNLQEKISQGIPIGNDISFLLGEVVLSQVDKALRLPPGQAVRWFDDYEITCDTLEEAEMILVRLRRELAKFQLRLNPMKTCITSLPEPVQPSWQQQLASRGTEKLNNIRDIVVFFDKAFELREENPDKPVLLYALGILFRLRSPYPDVVRVAESCISQAILKEPGAAQKAFALLSFWKLNGVTISEALWKRTIKKLIASHASGGFTSDVAWALSFCLDHELSLDKKTGQMLSRAEEDTIVLQALDMFSKGLLPEGFSTKIISRRLKDVDLDGEHWLLGYEAVRHGFLLDSQNCVSSNQFFKGLLDHDVTFYRSRIPSYASIVHTGGAPEWAVKVWLRYLVDKDSNVEDGELPLLSLIRKDLERLGDIPTSHDDMIADLLDILTPWEFESILEESTGLSGV
jgi:hypothetical protein